MRSVDEVLAEIDAERWEAEITKDGCFYHVHYSRGLTDSEAYNIRLTRRAAERVAQRRIGRWNRALDRSERWTVR